jgi:hypothetical protein
MSPEMLDLFTGVGYGEFIPEKSDVFSLGLTFIRLILCLKENEI